MATKKKTAAKKALPKVTGNSAPKKTAAAKRATIPVEKAKATDAEAPVKTETKKSTEKNTAFENANYTEAFKQLHKGINIRRAGNQSHLFISKGNIYNQVTAKRADLYQSSLEDIEATDWQSV